MKLVTFGNLANKTLITALSAVLILTGCQSTSGKLTRVTTVGPTMVGPSNASLKGTQDPTYRYNSQVFLDVAVPVFDPGFPLGKHGQINDDELLEQNIWPQVRRLEANRFAIETKKALSKTKAFGAISITPDASTSADLFVLGRIVTADGEQIEIGVSVIDASNTVWGEKVFKHTVSEGFFRDALRADEDPYGPVFTQIADYVFKLLVKRSDEQKRTVQSIADLRYAAMYSPENFSSYLSQKRNQQFVLEGKPANNDRMLQRINDVKAKDEQFVDALQTNYETFYAQTNDAYRIYQEESLNLMKELHAQEARRTKAQVFAAAGIIGGILLSKNSNSTAGNVGAAVATAIGAYNIMDAVKENKAISAQREMLEEQGQNLDLKVTPQVVEFNNRTIELSGSAKEQYTQLRQKLFEIYQLEATPETQL
jgi:stage V sporulation protein SpoVS